MQCSVAAYLCLASGTLQVEDADNPQAAFGRWERHHMYVHVSRAMNDMAHGSSRYQEHKCLALSSIQDIKLTNTYTSVILVLL